MGSGNVIMQDLTPILTRIPIPTPFPVGPVNAYLIRDEPLTLVDCGPDTGEAREALLQGLSAEGVGPEDLERIILTHFHTDHSGLCNYLRKASGAGVLTGSGEGHYLLGKPEEIQNTWADRILAFLMRGGVALKVATPITDWFRSREPRIGGLEEVLEAEGMTLPGKMGLEVIGTPGHSPGSVALHSPGEKVLISGDSLLERITPNPLVELDDRGGRLYSSLELYLGTLDVLEEINWEWCLPGHGSPFRRKPGFFQGIRKRIEDRHRLTASLLGPEPKSPIALSREIFGERKGGELFLALSEVVSHLDLMVMRGEARRLEENGLELFLACPTSD
jgi:glyoxylase-like metal-dependent hydrolase (beta-lactamase superfamily II)